MSCDIKGKVGLIYLDFSGTLLFTGDFVNKLGKYQQWNSY